MSTTQKDSQMFRIVVALLVTGALMISACRTMEPAKVETFESNLPDRFVQSIPDKGPIETDKEKNWWAFLESEELDNLINDALKNNYDLNNLELKVAQEKARLDKEKSGFFPSLGFSIGGSRKLNQSKSDSDSGTTTTGSHSWDASLTGNYTADIWGETSAGEKSQYASLLAAEFDLQETRLSVSSQLAQIWVDIIAVRNQKKILDQQIKINRALLDLQKLRFSNGKADALDVSQQREALATAKSNKPLLERQELLALNTLSFLMGRAETGNVIVATADLPDPPPMPVIGIPADLLKNRPDIQAAMARLKSSQWDIKEAEADLLPSLTLTAQALFSSGDFDLLFSNWVTSLAASLAGPIFDGGLRKAEVERVKAVTREKVNSYGKVIASAIKEVEDGLVKIRKQKEYIHLLEEELKLVRLTLEDAMLQYQNGQSSYLSYLTAWTSVERLERQLVSERAEYIKDRINLYTLLGWKTGT